MSREEIVRSFVKHNWKEAMVVEAMEDAKSEIEREHSIVFLQEAILKLLLEGDSKETVARVISKKGWPEDKIKKEMEDVDKGLCDLKKALEVVDLNRYNIEEIKKSLIVKGWPTEIVDYTLKNLIENIGYHRGLSRIREEVLELVHKGASSKEIQTRLQREGYDKDIIKKVIDTINKKLIHGKKHDVLRSFNAHIFAHDDWHKQMNGLVEELFKEKK